MDAATSAIRFAASIGPQLRSSKKLVKGLHDVPMGVQWAENMARMIRGFLSDVERLDTRGSEMVASWLNELREIRHQGEHIGQKYRIIYGKGVAERWFNSFCKPITLAFIGDEVNNMKTRLDVLCQTALSLGAVVGVQTGWPV